MDLDAELVAQARRGSAQAFDRLVGKHQQAVRGFLRRVCGDWSDADDLAQDTFVAAWAGLGRFKGDASVRSWLCAIAYRKALSYRRSAGRGAARDGVFVQLQQISRPEGADADDCLALADALKGLPIEQRAAVSLCLAADFSHAEAAEALGMPLGTIKSHVARGRARLLEALGDGHDRS